MTHGEHADAAGDGWLDVDDDDVVDARSRRAPEQPDDGGGFLEVVITIAAAIALAFLVQQFLVKPFRIPSGSMENTLRCGDRVLVDRLSYRFGDPERGDVVVFHPPAGVDERGQPDPTVESSGPEDLATEVPEGGGEAEPVRAEVNYIKRVVGVPGDVVEVRDHRAYVDGELLDEPYLRPLDQNAIELEGSELADWGPFEVPDDRYLMLGDHRDNSRDGRVFGFIPEQFVVGRAFMVYWPPRRVGGLPESDPGGGPGGAQDPNCLEAAGSLVVDEVGGQ